MSNSRHTRDADFTESGVQRIILDVQEDMYIIAITDCEVIIIVFFTLLGFKFCFTHRGTL